MENGEAIAMVYLTLFIFGLAYDRAVGLIERSSYARFVNTALLVVIGTIVTLAAATPLIGVKNAVLVLGAFVASGLPMAAGSYIRQIKLQHHDDAQSKTIAQEEFDDQTKNERIHDAQ